jgi:hypothetical protein
MAVPNGSRRSPKAEPIAIRWVRYAADCAEHVLCFTDSARPLAEAAIRAARAWADDPTEERREAAADAADDAEGDADYSFGYARDAVSAAAIAADATTSAAIYAADAAYSAVSAAYAAAYAADVREIAWQIERLRYYGLQYPAEAFA